MAPGNGTQDRYLLLRLVWSRPARDDRRTIREYITADDPRAAVALDELMSAKAARLAHHPELGRPGRIPNTRELVVHRNYLLIYDIIQDGVVRVLRVLHAARQWPPTEG